MDRPVPWEKAKDIIRGALSEVEKLSQESSRRVTGRINEGASTSSARPTSSDRSVFEEHKRLFGFKGPGLSSVSRKRYSNWYLDISNLGCPRPEFVTVSDL